MSRSIHSNRTSRQAAEKGYLDWLEIGKKRRVKRLVVEERQIRPEPAHVSWEDMVSIERVDDSAFLYFPASTEDMHCVLMNLPSAPLDGIRKIRLEAGTGFVNHEAEEEGVMDPFLGRKSREVYPGIYAPLILGMYTFGTNQIRLFGYAKSPETVPTKEQHDELQFQMLITLVHELAHHFDHTERVKRGRWRADDQDKCERFALQMERTWSRAAIMPYLLKQEAEQNGLD